MEPGYELGKLYGKELIEVNCFEPMDYLMPNLLHPREFAKRGHNQSGWIVTGVAERISAKLMTDNLHKFIIIRSMAIEGRYRRWGKIVDIFDVINPPLLEDRIGLLVDDVLITSGTAIIACADQSMNSTGIRVSVTTLAYAFTQGDTRNNSGLLSVSLNMNHF
ncbi:ComF family protein [Geofilum sp. OHC36d9]|uniref:ComF family protein n=1 Tax=Geofilum sp. OHC36d9 TaxID=3458413 RepID=UPI0040331865